MNYLAFIIGLLISFSSSLDIQGVTYVFLLIIIFSFFFMPIALDYLSIFLIFVCLFYLLILPPHLSSILSITLFYIFTRSISYNILVNLSYGFILGYSLLFVWAILDILVGTDRDSIVNGLSAVVIGRYSMQMLLIFLCLRFNSLSSNKNFLLLSVFLIFNGLIQAKTSFLLLFSSVFSNFFRLFFSKKYIFFATLFFSFLTFFLMNLINYFFNDFVSTDTYLASMSNRLAIFDLAFISYFNFELNHILFGSDKLIDSHFVYFDILLNLGILGLLFFIILIFLTLRRISIFPIKITFLFVSLYILAANSGGIWALREVLIICFLCINLFHMRSKLTV